MLRRSFAVVALALALIGAPAAADVATYRLPPATLERAFRAPALPVVQLTPARDTLAITQPLRFPPVADLARPMLRLAGVRIDPATNGIHHAPSVTALDLERIADGRVLHLPLPAGARITALRFSADGRRFAAANATPHGTELWLGTTATGRIARVPGVRLNGLFGPPFVWMPDGRNVLVRATERRNAPPVEATAGGPAVQEASGRTSRIVTYEDLLANTHDEALFAYYGRSQLTLVDAAAGTARHIGTPAMITDVAPSPDGHALLVEQIHTPFSYLFPWERFPTTVAVIDLDGRRVQRVVDRPLQDRLPEGGVATGPRDIAWRPDVPHTLTWFEARDGGDPRAAATVRDAIVAQPLGATAGEVATSPLRLRSLMWLDRDPRAIVRGYDRESQVTTTSLFDARAPGSMATLGTLKDGDRYRDPGTPVPGSAPNGETVALHDGDGLWLRGEGYAADGMHPFLDRYDLGTRSTTRVHASAPLLPLETPVTPLDSAGSRVLIRRQSPSDPPNYLVRTRGAADRVLTSFADPAPIWRSVQRKLVTYKRADGIDLSFTLYLPPGYREGTRVPAFLWAYPTEFADASVASQNSNTAQTFVLPGAGSAAFMALAGYAVLDNASIPIVGAARTVNDTYIEQLTAGAKAAVDEVVRLGIADPQRIAVGGHSYGAFMTMNLLAHTRLFQAGIARSGAYNRTLTPFGFQNERRSYWEATDLYTKMSPFTYARDIKDPVLMIHGMADDNTGTFPIQSERMYAAITGNGGTARLVMLPYEAHGYVGRESLETMFAEMVDWLDRWIGPKRTAVAP